MISTYLAYYILRIHSKLEVYYLVSTISHSYVTVFNSYYRVSNCMYWNAMVYVVTLHWKSIQYIWIHVYSKVFTHRWSQFNTEGVWDFWNIIVSLYVIGKGCILSFKTKDTLIWLPLNLRFGQKKYFSDLENFRQLLK